jgi:hypothetical protein
VALGIYYAAGKLSGQDALGYASALVGVLMFYLIGRSRGVPALAVAAVAGLMVSLPMLVLAVLTHISYEDHVQMFGQLMPAYCALLGASIGVTLGSPPNQSFKPTPSARLNSRC